MTAEITVLEFLSSESFLVLNRSILLTFGPNTTIFLSNLIDKYKFFKREGQLKENNWFYLTHEQQSKETSLTEAQIRTCKKTLKSFKILNTQLCGIPAKEYYQINWKMILETVETNHKDTVPQALQKHEGLSLGIMTSNNNNKLNHNKINNTSFIQIEKLISPKLFDRFWEAYPNKKEKGKTLTLWNKLCIKKDRPSWNTVYRAIKAQKETQRWKDGFIPLPTTWLNQNRWLDDPATMVSFSKQENKQTSSNQFEPMFSK